MEISTLPNSDEYEKILKKTQELYSKTSKNNSIKKIIELYENSPFYKIPLEIIDINEKDEIKIEAVINYGKYLLRSGQHKKALSTFEIALKIDSKNASAWYYTIITLKKIGAKKAAEKKINEALKKTNRHPGIINLKKPYASTNSYANKCLTTDSIEELRLITKNKPNNSSIEELAYYHHAIAFQALINKEASVAANNILLAIEIIPTEFRFWTLLSKILLQFDEPDNAFQAALEACTLSITPFTLDYLLLTSKKIGKYYTFDNLIEIKNNKNTQSSDILNLQAKRYQLSGDFELAFKLLSKSFEIDNKNPTTLLNLSLLSFDTRQFQAAFKSFNKIFSYYPEYKNDTQKRFYCLLSACFLNEWDHIDNELSDILIKIEKLNSLDTIIAAFFIMSLTDNFNMHAHIAKLTAKSILPSKNIHLTEKFKLYTNHKKIKVGYLSGDIGEHIVSHLFLPKLNRLNRSKFEPYVFSYRPNDGSSYYNEISSNSNFHDISKISDRDAAILIANQEIDILIDLTVYTSSSRSNIMSYRPAPIQLHHTGYPSTSGAPDVYDYMLVNKLLLSDSTLPYYTESLIIQPHVSSFTRVDFLNNISREEYHLPPDRFVLASFNEPQKISRHIFQLWCRILEQNPDSVLWIYTPDQYRRKNILKEAARYNVDHERLIFADKVDFEEHRQRLHFADLLLDTFPYGNHSSAKMALESGTPIVSYRGVSQASRVSSMHLTCANLDMLIADNDEAFINIANHYIQDTDFRDTCLSALEKTLNKNVGENTVDYEVYYEVALEMLYSRFKDNPASDAKQSFELPKLD